MALDLIIPKSYYGGYRGQCEAFWLEDFEAVDAPEVQVTSSSLLDPVRMRFLVGGSRV
jgi:hypothetical protein